MATHLQAATVKEVAKVAAEGGAPSAFLTEVAAAAQTITVAPVVVEEFNEEFMAEVVEVIEMAPEHSTTEPTSNPSASPTEPITDDGGVMPTDDDGGGVMPTDDDGGVLDTGAAAVVTSSKVAVFAGGRFCCCWTGFLSVGCGIMF